MGMVLEISDASVDVPSPMAILAISLKETQLIGNLTVLSVVNAADADQPIHIISPRDDVDDGSKESGFVDSSILKLGEIEEMESHNFQADIPGETLRTVYEEARISYVDGTDKMNFLKDISSFDNFLEHIDGHLREIETDIVTLVKLSTLVMENEQQQKSLKDQQALQVLKDICSIRRRIESIIQSKTEET
uniref:Type II inositol 3,4-bisphosphate 4-phosphatase n=1 Tax=Anthurium amnicola TaxID=1678845 RepID=A0A1D1Z491_9ARAE